MKKLYNIYDMKMVSLQYMISYDRQDCYLHTLFHTRHTYMASLQYESYDVSPGAQILQNPYYKYYIWMVCLQYVSNGDLQDVQNAQKPYYIYHVWRASLQYEYADVELDYY